MEPSEYCRDCFAKWYVTASALSCVFAMQTMP
ncbi:MAG: DUF1244 domain-containing protein [Bacteroidia bacterium]|nr:DUF1244 domain-containing protein [Bacteroidia bacterium]